MKKRYLLSSCVMLSGLVVLASCQSQSNSKKTALKKEEETTVSSSINTSTQTSTTSTQQTSSSSINMETSTSLIRDTQETSSFEEKIQASKVEEVPVENAATWSTEKSAKLDAFMKTFGEEMGQQYISYEPGENVKLYGVYLPDTVIMNLKGWQMAVDKEPVTISWGVGEEEVDTDYRLLAVHSDADSAPYAGKHVYFFTFHHGEPRVLLTMQNQGNPDNYLYFYATTFTFTKQKILG